MKNKAAIVLVAMILLLSACGSKSVKQSGELGSSPPLPIITVDDRTIDVTQSSYCWTSKNKSECVDYAGPEEMLKDKPMEQVYTNARLNYKFDVKKPSEMSVTLFHDGSFATEELTTDFIEAPSEPGIYYYNVSALWLLDKEKRISEGSSSYVFAIEVVLNEKEL